MRWAPSRLSFLAAPRLITTRVPQTKLMKWPESQTDFEVIGHASVKVLKLTRQNEGCIVDKFRRPVHLSLSF